MRTHTIRYGLLILASGLLTACDTGITFGGNVTGLTGSGLVLRNTIDSLSASETPFTLVNEALSIDADGAFSFKKHFPVGGANYSVTVDTQPTGQFCMVSNGYGRTPKASVTNIDVQCHAGTSFQLLAGGPSGSADGTGAEARFDVPVGIAFDSAGNAYVGDQGNRTVRKITPNGVVTTLAGTAGQIGSADGMGANATFNLPDAIAVDGTGNVYVADTGNHNIRKISAAGAVTTLAGVAGNSGNADGPGTTATFNEPNALGVDSLGNVYVADAGNSAIRKITPQGVVTTLAGAADVRAAYVSAGGWGRAEPSLDGIAVDGANNIYSVDKANGTVLKITPAGAITVLAGDPDSYTSLHDGVGANASFGTPNGAITIDTAGNLYLADLLYVRKITPAGAVTTVGQWGTDRFLGGHGLAVSADKLFITTLYTVMWSPKP